MPASCVFLCVGPGLLIGYLLGSISDVIRMNITAIETKTSCVKTVWIETNCVHAGTDRSRRRMCSHVDAIPFLENSAG